MNYIVLDMEWNQAIRYTDMVKEPVFLTGEILQIGAVKLDETFRIVDTFNERVAPEFYTELHPHVAEVTKLSPADLRSGKPFCKVFSAFSDWCGYDFVFLIWGTEDLRVLRKNMALHDIDTSFMPAAFNLQNIFSAQITHTCRQYRLTAALSLFNETPFDAHDALNDAKSTALLCSHLDLAKGLAEYSEIVENRDGIVEQYRFEELYEDIEDALSDDYVVSFECPRCGDIVWGEGWVKTANSATQLALASCPDGQEFLIKLKFRSAADDKVSVRRLVYALTDALRAEYEACAARAAAWSKYVISA